MNQSCEAFRQRLRTWLSAPCEGSHAAQHALDGQALAWNAHLLGCAPCRRLLEDERALNELLECVPAPRLTALQRERLMALLQHDVRLEALLALADPAAPAGLAERIWARVQAEPEELALDDSLAHIDAIEAPAGLAQRVWERCQQETERVPVGAGGPQAPRARQAQAQKPARRKLAPRHWWSTGLAAAGLAAFLWFLPGTEAPADRDLRSAQTDPRGSQNPEGGEDPDPELLAMLETLEIMDMVDELDSEEWELLEDYDPFALLALGGEWVEPEDGSASEGESR